MESSHALSLKQSSVAVQEWVDSALVGKMIRDSRMTEYIADGLDVLSLRYGGFRIVKRQDGEFDIVVNPKSVGSLLQDFGIIPEAGVSAESLIENRVICYAYAAAARVMEDPEYNVGALTSSQLMTNSAREQAFLYATKKGISPEHMLKFKQYYLWSVMSGYFKGTVPGSVQMFAELDKLVFGFQEEFGVKIDTIPVDLNGFFQVKEKTHCVVATATQTVKDAFKQKCSDEDKVLVQKVFDKLVEPEAGKEISHIDVFGNYVQGKSIVIQEKKYPEVSNPRYTAVLTEHNLTVLLKLEKIKRRLDVIRCSNKPMDAQYCSMIQEALNTVMDYASANLPVGTKSRPHLPFRLNFISDLVVHNYEGVSLSPPTVSVRDRIEKLYPLVKSLDATDCYYTIVSSPVYYELEKLRIQLLGEIFDVKMWLELLDIELAKKLIFVLMKLTTQGDEILKGIEYKRDRFYHFAFPLCGLMVFKDNPAAIRVYDYLSAIVDNITMVDAGVGMHFRSMLSTVYDSGKFGVLEEKLLSIVKCDVGSLFSALSHGISQVGVKMCSDYMKFENVVFASAKIGEMIATGRIEQLKKILRGPDKKFIAQHVAQRYLSICTVPFPMMGGGVANVMEPYLIKPSFVLLPWLRKGEELENVIMPSPTYLMAVCNYIRNSVGLQRMEHSWFSCVAKPHDGCFKIKLYIHTTGSGTFGVTSTFVISFGVHEISKVALLVGANKMLFHALNFMLTHDRIENPFQKSSIGFCSLYSLIQINSALVQNVAHSFMMDYASDLKEWCSAHKYLNYVGMF